MTDILKRNNVAISGDGDKTIIYAHGFGCNQEMWSAIWPAFAQDYKQVLFDYVGSGQSDLLAWDEKRYSALDGYADDIIEICDALGLTKDVIIVGHSVSATIALLASIKRPNLFSKLILVGPTPCFLNYPPEYNGGFNKEDLVGLLDLMESNYMGWAAYLAPVVSGGEGNEFATDQLETSFCSTDPIAAKVFAKATFFSDNRDDLAKVDAPCLILQHRDDALVPLEVGEYTHKNLKNSTYEVLDVTGHCAHMSHPQLVISAMENYLNGA